MVGDETGSPAVDVSSFVVDEFGPPIFFVRYMGDSLSDPVTLIRSVPIPGCIVRFGLVDVLFFSFFGDEVEDAFRDER